MDRIYGKPKKPDYATTRARVLRQEATSAEQILWERLRGRQLMGLKFRRQKPIGRYVADFYCAEKSLVLELDGTFHNNRKRYDATRDELMGSCGLRVLRIPNEKVFADIDSIFKEISAMLA